MKDLMSKDGRGVEIKSVTDNVKAKVDEYRSKIGDDSYLDHAIQKIASDLSHYLTK